MSECPPLNRCVVAWCLFRLLATHRTRIYVTLVYGDLLLNTFDGAYSTSERRTYIVSWMRRSVLSVNKEQFYTKKSVVQGGQIFLTEEGGWKRHLLRCPWELNNSLLSAVSSALHLTRVPFGCTYMLVLSDLKIWRPSSKIFETLENRPVGWKRHSWNRFIKKIVRRFWH